MGRTILDVGCAILSAGGAQLNKRKEKASGAPASFSAAP